MLWLISLQMSTSLQDTRTLNMHQHIHFIWPFDQQHSSEEFTFSAVLHKLESGEVLHNKLRVLSHSVYMSWLPCWHSGVTLVTVMKAYICQRDWLTLTYNNFVFHKRIFFCILWLAPPNPTPIRQLAHISVNSLRDDTHLYRSQGLMLIHSSSTSWND